MTIKVEVIKMDGKPSDSDVVATFTLAAPANWTQVTLANLGLTALPNHCRVRFSSDAEAFKWFLRDPVSSQNSGETAVAPPNDGTLFTRYNGGLHAEISEAGAYEQIWVKQA